jgi:HD-GYP domain-containing protein (c-di-GMP phosphodiesterase class II)
VEPVTPPPGRAPGEESGDEGYLRQAGRAFLVTLYAALRALKLYPVENAAVQRALDELEASAGELNERTGGVSIRLSGDFLFVNGVRLRLELDNYASFSHVHNLLRSFHVGALDVHPGIERREWQVFLAAVLALAGQGTEEERFDRLAERLGQAGVARLELQPAGDLEEDRQHAREVAKRTYSQGVAVTRELVSGIRLGRAPNVRRAKRAVQLIVDQVLTDETSLVGLTTLRDYDEYTFTHSVNVCIFSVALGRKLGLTRLQLYDLGLVALLHDIGKARIPLEVLNKPDGLTEPDWELLKTHSWQGALTLFGLRGMEEAPYPAILVAHEHHMKTNLTGYPRHIRPRTLGLFTRVVAVADGYDAATSRRAYQSIPIEPDEVLREMWENPRRGYDPLVVKALISLLGIYPVGTCVVLDTFEVAVVTGANPDPTHLNRPLVTLVIDEVGTSIPPPGLAVNLADRSPDGGFRRSIVKVTNPDRVGLEVSAYFI